MKQHAELLRAKIDSLPPTVISSKSDKEIHLLCGHSHTPLGCFALYSFLRYVQFDITVFVHDDGSLADADRQVWTSLFPNVIIVSTEESNIATNSLFATKQFPLLETMCREHIYAKKVVDFHLFGSAHQIAILDTDILFFRSPDELFRLWNRKDSINNTITTFDDIGSSYVDSVRSINRVLGDIPERFNSGMCLLNRFGPADFAEVEEILRTLANQKPDLSKHLWVEQTIYAILAGRRTLYRMSPAYQIGGATEDPVAVHYAGLFRELFFTEGIPMVECNPHIQ